MGLLLLCQILASASASASVNAMRQDNVHRKSVCRSFSAEQMKKLSLCQWPLDKAHHMHLDPFLNEQSVSVKDPHGAHTCRASEGPQTDAHNAQNYLNLCPSGGSTDRPSRKYFSFLRKEMTPNIANPFLKSVSYRKQLEFKGKESRQRNASRELNEIITRRISTTAGSKRR